MQKGKPMKESNAVDVSGRPLDTDSPTKDAMIACLNDPTADPALRDRAATVLAWYQDFVAGYKGDELEAGAYMLAELRAGWLWSGRAHLEKRKDVLGQEKVVVVLNPRSR